MKTHIKSFGVENFRVFKEMTNFELAPITILTGANSSGKSSLTKALMLLKESMIKNELAQLDFDDSEIKLGSFTQNLNNTILEDTMKFKIETPDYTHRRNNSLEPRLIFGDNTYVWDLDYYESTLTRFMYSKNDAKVFGWQNDWKNAKKRKQNEKQVTWEIVLNYIECTEYFENISTIIGMKKFKKLKSEIIKKFQEDVFYFESKLYGIDVFSFYKNIIESLTSIGDPNIYIDFRNSDDYIDSAQRGEEMELNEFIDPKWESILGGELYNIKISELISGFSPQEFDAKLLTDKLKGIHHIKGNINQEIVYTLKDYPEFIALFKKMKSEEGRIEWYVPSQKGSFKIIPFLKKWLVDEFKIITKIEDLKFNLIEGYGITIQLGDDLSLYQVGYGVTKLLPIILQLALKDKAIFIIEEPEANLHPALQSKLADMFMDAIKEFEIQIIVETHSEYLIRKLQFLTAKKEINPADTQIHYFYAPDDVPEGENQIYPINIQEDGSLSKNFGKGFFDEADNIALELFLLKNQQNN
jgi:predicted ATPase